MAFSEYSINDLSINGNSTLLKFYLFSNYFSLIHLYIPPPTPFQCVHTLRNMNDSRSQLQAWENNLYADGYVSQTYKEFQRKGYPSELNALLRSFDLDVQGKIRTIEQRMYGKHLPQFLEIPKNLLVSEIPNFEEFPGEITPIINQISNLAKGIGAKQVTKKLKILLKFLNNADFHQFKIGLADVKGANHEFVEMVEHHLELLDTVYTNDEEFKRDFDEKIRSGSASDGAGSSN